ncbi:MAG: class I SAM-dependent methyltransferase [Burkholderiales bacterium]
MNDNAMNWEQAVLWLRNQPDQAELVRACFYDDPLIDAARRFHECGEWRAVRELLPRPPGRALDVGAGRGISSYALAREGWQVTALEPDPSAVVGAAAIRSLAKEAQLEIEVVQERGEHLPFPPSSFDLVYCRQALHHARELRQLCMEIGRVLKPGGRFIAIREHVISRREDLPAFLESHPLHSRYGGENAYLLDEYKQAIDGGGVRLIKVLNPLQSEINTFPETLQDIKRGMARRVAFPFPGLIPDLVVSLRGRFLRQPGRLYSFVGEKTDNG